MPVRSFKTLPPEHVEALRAITTNAELAKFAKSINLSYSYALEMRQAISKAIGAETGIKLPRLMVLRKEFPNRKPRPDLNIKKPSADPPVKRLIRRPFARPSWFEEDLNALTRGAFEFFTPKET